MNKKIKHHCKLWNEWRKRNGNGSLHKILVLLCINHSPTFEAMKIYNKKNTEEGSDYYR